jgi:hypothetical protein
MEYCYITQQSLIDEDTLVQLDEAVACFHCEHEIFRETGMWDDFSLPHQHSLVHYCHLIQQFGAPNGLCSSITESKHIKAVKEPWRRSSRNEPLGQMLITNQRLDKLAAARVDFASHGMLGGTLLTAEVPPQPLPNCEDNDVEDAPGMTSMGKVKLAHYPGNVYHYSVDQYAKYRTTAWGYGRTVDDLANELDQPKLLEHIRQFLYDQLYPDSELCGMDMPLNACPKVHGSLRIKVFHSAISTYYAPSNLSGVGGMHHKRICATPSWK